MNDRYLSVAEICTYFGIKRDTVYKWISEKEFPFTIAKNLSDKEWVSSKLEETGERIRHFEGKCKEYNELLRVLLVSKETGVN